MANEESREPSSETPSPVAQRLLQLRDRFNQRIAQVAASNPTPLVNSFNQFRRSHANTPQRQRRRARGRPTRTITIQVSLLPSPFVKNIAQLSLQGGAKLTKLKCPLEMSAEDFYKELEKIFPSLKDIEVAYCRAGVDKKLVKLPDNINTPKLLKESDEFKKSLYLLPLNLPAQVRESAMRAVSPQPSSSATGSSLMQALEVGEPDMAVDQPSTSAAITNSLSQVPILRVRHTNVPLVDVQPSVGNNFPQVPERMDEENLSQISNGNRANAWWSIKDIIIKFKKKVEIKSRASYIEAGTPTVLFRISDDVPVTSESATLEQILFEVSTIIDREARKNIANVTRQNVLDGAKRCFQKKTFKFTSPLDVKFVGEDGIDEGGPCREFMRLVLKAIQASSIFKGPESDRQIVYSYNEYEKEDYYWAGAMLGCFMIHGGPLPKFLASCSYSMMAYDQVKLSIEDLVETEYEELRTNLKNISLSTVESFFESVDPIMDTVIMAGCGNLVMSPQNKDKIVQGVLQFLVKEKNRGCIAQFCKGLECTGLYSKIRQFPETMRGAFVHSEMDKLSSARLLDLFKIEWAPEHSNRRRKEEIVVSFFRDLVEEFEADDDCELEKLLVFATGADTIPVLGFHPQPRITFGHPSDIAEEYIREFPKANTCGLVLRLPVLADYDQFCKNMRAALQIEIFTTA